MNEEQHKTDRTSAGPDTAERSEDRQEAANGESGTPPAVRDEVLQLKAELAEAQDRALRSLAEMENFRRRTRRELEDERRYASVPLLRDLLPVFDNINRAIAAAEKTQDAASLLEGFKMVRQQLDEVLQRHQCREIPALGEPFDPNRHEAISAQPSAEHAPNTVLHVVQPGFQIHDRVIRPSQVIVSIGQ
jgi:molecular chaperone GrpE